MPREEVLRRLEELSRQDVSYSSGRVLSSMCTSPHPLAKEVFCRFLETNLGDTGLFRGTKKIEELAIRELGEMLGNPNAKGFILSGGTEANLLALWSARELSKKKEVIVPETAHFSFEKAARLLGLRLVRARVDEHKSLLIEDVRKKLSRDTCALVGIAGSTEYGAVDDIEALSEIAESRDIYLHVDAAFGGFVLPFMENPPKFDFSLPGVCSITVDPHKMGLVPVPAGGILFRDEHLLKPVESHAPYLIEKIQHTIVGTRTGAGAASTLAMLWHLGREGYTRVVRECMETTLWLYHRIKALGFSVFKPRVNILVFTGKNIDRIADNLQKMDWKISRTRAGEIRLVLMPHFKREHAEKFIRDLEKLTEGLASTRL